MPFKSERQKRFLWSQHPDIARRWTEEGKGKMYGTPPKSGKGGTVANNSPVGTAGQPMRKHAKMDEKRFGAIGRRLSKLQGDKSKGKK